MRKIWDKLQEQVNDYSIRKKLLILYMICVLLPLFLTDGVILYIVFDNERSRQKYEFESIASAVESDLTNSFEEAINFTNNIYINRTLNEFMETSFDSPLKFFEASRKFTNDPFFFNMSSDQFQVILYGDNEDIVNGGMFYRLSSLEGDPVYEKMKESGRDLCILFYYKENDMNVVSHRKISILRKLDFYKYLESEKLIRVNVDYSNLVRRFQEMRYNAPVYVCSGNQILFSNDGHSETKIDYETLTGKEKVSLERTFTICGEEFRILIMRPENGLFPSIAQHIPLLMVMVLVNILLPMILVYLINRSFTSRLSVLSEAFDRMDTEELEELSNIEGKDEIAALMLNYNRMVRRMKELIRTVYKDRLDKQKNDIARQQAELLALHSQIDPHSLFNMLESIRMHSILKHELETAGMVERLAVLTRQNVDWSTDQITIGQETEYIKQYLELQKYRFGERLSYEITVAPSCLSYRIPKLTLVTFIENSCVHGIEKKSVPCWIYLRVYEEGEDLIMEVEDTGGGMEEAEAAQLNEKMNQVDIEDIKKKKHVGVLNACLRLKMATGDRVSFEMESEVGIGTFLVIRIPKAAIGKQDITGIQEAANESFTGR